jgi:hypothetical protein
MSASVQVCDRGQQLAGQMIFGYKGVFGAREELPCRVFRT